MLSDDPEKRARQLRNLRHGWREPGCSAARCFSISSGRLGSLPLASPSELSSSLAQGDVFAEHANLAGYVIKRDKNPLRVGCEAVALRVA